LLFVADWENSLAVSDHQEHVTRALEVLTVGLIPFVEGELRAVYQGAWIEQIRSNFRDQRQQNSLNQNTVHWDALALLTVMWDHWNTVFRRKLSPLERSLVGELREFRNRWAHRGNFDFDDTYRTLDSVSRLLKATESGEVRLLQVQKRELLEELFADEVNANTQRQLSARERWKVITVNSFCGMLLVSTLFWMWRIQAWPFAVLISFGMGYLTFRSLTVDPPVVGIRECPRCRKIIYSLTCPYCEKTVVGRRTPRSDEKRNDPSLPLATADDDFS
jgi:hypothetical protein